MIRNLLLDLGGVLLDIDVQRTFRAFQALVPADRRDDYPELRPEIAAHKLFCDFETGAVSPDGFRAGLRWEFGLQSSDAEIDAAWNALLLDVPPERETQVAALARQYRLVLLSNTNKIHHDAFADRCAGVFAHFERCYMSYEMGLRKPDRRIFEVVLSEMNMQPNETLFVDDSAENIAGATVAGLQVRLFDPEKPFFV